MQGLEGKNVISPHAVLCVTEIICLRSLYGIFKMSFEMERWCAVWMNNSRVFFSPLAFEYSAYLHNAEINSPGFQSLLLLLESTTPSMAQFKEEPFFSILENHSYWKDRSGGKNLNVWISVKTMALYLFCCYKSWSYICFYSSGPASIVKVIYNCFILQINNLSFFIF